MGLKFIQVSPYINTESLMGTVDLGTWKVQINTVSTVYGLSSIWR